MQSGAPHVLASAASLSDKDEEEEEPVLEVEEGETKNFYFF